MMISDLKVKLGIAVVVICLVAQAVFFYLYIHKARAHTLLVYHTFEVIQQFNRWDRSYSLTERRFLEFLLNHKGKITDASYNEQIAKFNELKQGLNDIRSLAEGNIIQQQNIRLLMDKVNKRVQFLRQVEENITPERVLGEQNQKSIDSVFTAVDNMRVEEKRLLEQRTKKAKELRETFLLLLSTACIVTYSLIFILIGLLFFSRRDIQAREARSNLAIKGSNDALWDWDPNTGKVYYSPRYKELLGYPGNAWKSNLDEFNSRLHPEDVKPVWDALTKHLEHNARYDVEYRLKHFDGQFKWFRARGQAVWDKNCKPIRMSGFISDISDRKEVERLKDEFVSTISHELRTPLTSIRGSIGLLLAETEGPLTDEMRHFLEIAYSNSERLIFLINDILDIDKIESGKMRFDLTTLNMPELIRSAVELNLAYSQKYNIRYKIHEPLIEAEVFVDKDRLLQVVTNLLSNAAKFSEAGSEVEIITTKSNNLIRVSVTDHGAGIPKESQDLLFRKFSQTRNNLEKNKDGSGLGLYISKQIIEKMGGQIGFESTSGKGATFYFDLPIQIKPEIAAKEEPSSTCRARAKLLICEDDFEIANYQKKIISKLGFDTDVATTVAQAKKFLKAQSYSGILLDVILPDQNGIQFIFELRSDPQHQAMPVIIVSIRAIEEERIYGKTLGVLDWIKKPIDPDKLEQAIQKIPNHAPVPVVLYIEDDRDLINVITRKLQGTAEVISAPTVKEAKQVLQSTEVDLVLLDLLLPDGNGAELIDVIEKDSPKPVVILSANEVSESISKKVAATFIKSRTSEATIINTIKLMVGHNLPPMGE